MVKKSDDFSEENLQRLFQQMDQMDQVPEDFDRAVDAMLSQKKHQQTSVPVRSRVPHWFRYAAVAAIAFFMLGIPVYFMQKPSAASGWDYSMMRIVPVLKSGENALADSRNITDVDLGKSLENGASLITSSGSTVRLQIKENSQVHLGESTRVTLHYNHQDQLKFELLQGSLSVKIDPLKKGLTFEVETRNLNVRVVGTCFQVIASPSGESRVIVHEGKVRVSRKGSDEKPVLITKEMELVDKTGSFDIHPIETAAISEFIELNASNPVKIDNSGIIEFKSDLENHEITVNNRVYGTFKGSVSILTDEGEKSLTTRDHQGLSKSVKINLEKNQILELSEEKLVEPVRQIKERNFNPVINFGKNDETVFYGGVSADILVVSGGEKVTALSEGEDLLWEKTLAAGSGIIAMPPIVTANSVYLVTREKYLIQLRLKDGQELSRTRLSNLPARKISFHDTHVYIPQNESLLVMDTGLSGRLMNLPVNGANTPVIYSGYILINSYIEKKIQCYDLNGKFQWSLNLSGRSFCPPLMMNSKIYSMDTRGNLSEIDITGKLVRQYRLPSPAVSEMFQQGNAILFTGLDGQLYRHDTGSGVTSAAGLIQASPDPDQYLNQTLRTGADETIITGNLSGDVILFYPEDTKWKRSIISGKSAGFPAILQISEKIMILYPSGVLLSGEN